MGLIYFLIIIEFFILNIILIKSIDLDLKYSITKSLPSGEYFTIDNTAIKIYDKDFNLKNNLYSFSKGEQIGEDSDYYKKTKVEEYIEKKNFYILSLVKGSYFFIYDYNQDKLFKNITLKVESGTYYSIIPYKKENSNLFYIVTTKKSNTIYFYLYRIDLSSNNPINILIINNNYRNNSLSGNFFNCNKMILEQSGSKEVLVCFYQIEIKSENLVAKSFDINNNFTEINEKIYNLDDDVEEIKSGTSFDKKNAFICFKEDDYINCLIYNIDENKFRDKKKIGNYKDAYDELFFPETNQFALIRLEEDKFKIYILNESYSQVEIKLSITIYLSECDKIKGFSLVYSQKAQEYILISNCRKENNWEFKITYSSIKVNFTNYYNNIFLSNNSKSTTSLTSSISDTALLYNSFTSILDSSFLSSTIFTNSNDFTSSFSFNSSSSFIYNSTLSSDISITDYINTRIISSLSNRESSIFIQNQIIKNKIEKNKEEIITNLQNIINDIEIGKNYEIKGEDFNLIIKPTNSSYLDSVTHVNFSKCEQILREKLNISSSRILTFLQMEIDNKNDKSLVNQVEYQVYDDNKKLLDLSLCNDTNIKIFYSLKNKSLDISSISSFKNSGIDIFNINDSFFNDICQSYSDSKNDIVLKDRIKDIYINYSLCENGCSYSEFNDTFMTISCDCKVKKNISINNTNLNLKQLDNIYIDSNFGLIKCYNLVFSFKGKLNNIGFWIFLILTTLHIPIFFCYFIKGIESIKEYLYKEMKKYGYIKEKSNICLKKCKTLNFKKKKLKKKFLHSPPLKHKNKIHNKKNNLNNNSSINNIKLSDKQIIKDINSNQLNIRYQEKENNINNKSKKKHNSIKSKRSNKRLFSQEKTQIESLPTKGIEKTVNIDKDKSIFNFCLININLNNIKEYRPQNSNLVLNNYTFNEAIKYDLRSVCLIFYIYLLSKQAVFHAFLYKSPLELFPLRLCLLIFIISCDLALNAVFYLDDKISKKYRNAQNLFLFTFNNNITIILLSTLIGFIIMTLFTNLSNSINGIRDVFRKEEEKIKNYKKYIITEKRKKEIVKEIEAILKKYKIKVIILIIFELLSMLFFWYYVTSFCHVYSSTQISWLLNSFLSILSRLFIEIFLSLAFAKLYRMSVEANVKCLYKIALFFYCFA